MTDFQNLLTRLVILGQSDGPPVITNSARVNGEHVRLVSFSIGESDFARAVVWVSPARVVHDETTVLLDGSPVLVAEDGVKSMPNGHVQVELIPTSVAWATEVRAWNGDVVAVVKADS